MKNLTVFRSVVMLSLLLFLSTPRISHATTYYVDRNHSSASDTNPGTLDLPWLTIQHAAETLIASDTVYVRSGTYNEHVHIMNSGTAAGYIVFSAYPGESPVIDGTGVTDVGNLVIVDQHYFKFTGFEIGNFNGCAIWIENAAYIVISDCVIHDVEFGIGVADGTHDFEFNRIEAYHFDYYGFDVSPSGGADCYNGTFNDCFAHEWRDPALGHECDGFALSHEGSQHDFVLNRCEAHTVGDGFVIGGSKVTVNRCSAHDAEVGYKIWGDDVIFVNCISYHNESSNLELDWDGEPGTTTVQNCTFMHAQTYNIWVENAGDSLHMYNCILSSGDNIGLTFEQMGVSHYEGDYNIFHHNDADRAIVVGYSDEFSLDQITAGEWTTYSGQDAHSLVAHSDTSLYIDPANFDLHLLQTSPAVDKGSSVGAPSDDYDGNPRPSGNGYDIGAFEYQSSVGVFGNGSINSIPEIQILFQNYPNPFNPSTIIKYDLPESDFVTLKIYNLCSQEVETLVNEFQTAGEQEMVWQPKSLPSGIYFYRLQTSKISKTKKLMLQQ
jgi:hypothetical protein